MSYQVLARKWRPATFADLAGQDHVVTALTEDPGVLRCRHGNRLVVLYARGVAAVEVAPRGAVL